MYTIVLWPYKSLLLKAIFLCQVWWRTQLFYVRSHEILQQHVLYVAIITQLTTKGGCNIYKNLQKLRGKTPNQLRRSYMQPCRMNVDTDDNYQSSFKHFSNTHPKSNSPTNFLFSNITTNQQSPDIAEQLTVFLNEFKAVFNQLISQNSIVLNMLNTVITKLAH